MMVLAVAAVAVSCQKKQIKQVNSDITQGTWYVSHFSEDGVDETQYFTGYNFTFSDDGTVTATNGTNTISGTWSTSKSSSDDDSNDPHFNLTFPATNNFDELSDDWHITSSSDTQLDLEDVSGGDGSIDKLTFKKN